MTALTTGELRDTQLRILDAFIAECNSKDLTFFLYYGSLIGSVRHNGIIPWDDDIDLAMPRSDFERLKEIDWGGHDCKLILPSENVDTPYLMGKISDRRTVLVDNIDSAMSDIGVNIDIFPLDYVDIPGIRARAVVFLIGVLKISQIFKTVKLSRKRIVTRNAALAIGKLFLIFISANTIVRLANLLACRAGEKNFVGSLLGPYGRRELMDPDFFSKIVDVEFEGRTLPAPSGYSHILTRLYGNYMKLPPKETQVSHHCFKAFHKKSDNNLF